MVGVSVFIVVRIGQWSDPVSIVLSTLQCHSLSLSHCDMKTRSRVDELPDASLVFVPAGKVGLRPAVIVC